MDLQTVLMFGGAGALAFLAGKLIVRGDTAVEERRRRAVDLSSFCKVNGLPELATLLADYSVGDYSGVASQLKTIFGIVADSELSKRSLDSFLEVQLKKRLDNAEGRESLVKFVENHLKITIPREFFSPKPAELVTKADV
jgi:hypothetical protein